MEGQHINSEKKTGICAYYQEEVGDKKSGNFLLNLLPPKNDKNNLTCWDLARIAKHIENNAILMSSMHFDDTVDPDSGKPEIISFYSDTKCALDIVNKMITSIMWNKTQEDGLW